MFRAIVVPLVGICAWLACATSASAHTRQICEVEAADDAPTPPPMCRLGYATDDPTCWGSPSAPLPPRGTIVAPSDMPLLVTVVPALPPVSSYEVNFLPITGMSRPGFARLLERPPRLA